MREFDFSRKLNIYYFNGLVPPGFSVIFIPLQPHTPFVDLHFRHKLACLSNLSYLYSVISHIYLRVVSRVDVVVNDWLQLDDTFHTQT